MSLISSRAKRNIERPLEDSSAAERKEKKKRKRDNESEGSKKDKKKHKQEAEPAAGELETSAVVDEPGMLMIQPSRMFLKLISIAESEPKKKSKKDKKKSKPSSETTDAVEAEPSPAKDEKKKKRKHQDAQPENVASSSKTAAAPPSKAEIDKFLADNSITIHGTTPLTPILAFDQLDVPAGLRAACDKFSAPTPIQACSWPAMLAGQDVVGIAETGRYKLPCILAESLH